MSRWFRQVACFAIAGVCIGSLVWAQTCQGQVLLNEVLADPASDWDGDGATDFKSDEWVEIVNVGAAPVVLDDYRLSDASGAFRYGFTGSLAAGGRVLVYGSASVAWESAQGLSTVGLSLNNGGDTVQLLRLDNGTPVVVDTYTYAAHEVLDDRSTGRMPDGASQWVVFDGLNPYNGTDPPAGSNCQPTPNAANDCPTPVDTRTWSQVKALYGVF